MGHMHNGMKVCDDCGRRVSGIVTGSWSRDLGQVVCDDEKVCVACLEARKALLERQCELFEEVHHG